MWNLSKVAAQAGHLCWKVAHVPETRSSVTEVPLFAPHRLTECLSPDGGRLEEVCVCEDWEEGMDHWLGNGVFENYFKTWDVPSVLIRAGNEPSILSSKMKR